MPKNHRKRSSKSHQRGGDLAGNPPSAWGWGLGTAGNGWTQFMNSLTLQPGENLGTVQSNALVPVGNLNAQSSQGMIGSNLKGDIPHMGGKRVRHRRTKSKTRKGGSVSGVLSQAAAPFLLLAGQQMLGRRKGKNYNNKTFKRTR